jgi:RNase adaptor protein for sRNA GlmZ degradation
MQALGAYGLRGYYEKKEHFLKSIPFAVQNLRYILENYEFSFETSVLKNALVEIINSEKFNRVPEDFCVTINSFAYRKGIPVDNSGHGGGYVFDCRAIPNPAQYVEYKDKTGKDIEVIEFFENEEEMKNFLNNVFSVVDQSVEKYLKRNFKHLSVSFGCTGGQHRSVYSAETLFAHLKEKFNVSLKINHVELEKKEAIQKENNGKLIILIEN